MVEAHQGQQRGVQVGGVHPAFDGVQAVLVGGAVGEARLHAGAGQPHRVAGDVVVAAVGALRGRHAGRTRCRTAPAFRPAGRAAPGRPAARRSAGRWPRSCDQALVQVVVMVPAGLADLDEPHARFAQPAGHQALPGEAAGRAGLHAVGVAAPLAAPSRCRAAPAPCPASGRPVRTTRSRRRARPVRPGGAAGRGSSPGSGRAACAAASRRSAACRFGEVAGVVDPRPLKVGRQEGAAVVDRAAEVRRRVDRDVAGQILVLGAQAVQQPGPHRRPRERGERRAGVQLNHRLRVGRRVGVQAAEEAELVDVLGRCAGYSSETQVPVWPCWLNLNFEPTSVPPPGPTLPSSLAACGLYSKVSIWDIAPSMNRKMIRLALTGNAAASEPAGRADRPAACAGRTLLARACRQAPGSRSPPPADFRA